MVMGSQEVAEVTEVGRTGRWLEIGLEILGDVGQEWIGM